MWDILRPVSCLVAYTQISLTCKYVEGQWEFRPEKKTVVAAARRPPGVEPQSFEIKTDAPSAAP